MAFSGFMERTKLRLMVDSATGNSDDPTPIYVLDELVQALAAGDTRAGVDAVSARLAHRSPVVKQKALKLVTHIGRKGSPDLRRLMARHSAAVRELLTFRCEPDAFKGDTVWKRVQEYAQEALNALHGEPEAAAPTNSSLRGRIEGFGSGGGSGGGGGYGGGGSMQGFGSDSAGGGYGNSSGGRMLGFGSADVVQSGMQAISSGMRTLSGGRADGYSAAAQMDSSSSYGGGGASSRAGGSLGQGPLLQPGATALASTSSSSAAGAGGRQGAAGTSASGGAEQRLVDRVCMPAGLRAAPSRDDLRAFVDSVSSLDGPTVAQLLEHKLDAGPWQSALRALCAIEAVVEGGSSAACGQVAAHFQTHPEAVRRAADSPQASVRQRAAKLLTLLGDAAAPAAPGGSSIGAAGAQQQQLFTEDLLGEAEGGAGSSGTSAAALADLLGDAAPSGSTSAAAAASSAGELLAGLDLDLPAATPPAVGAAAAAGGPPKGAASADDLFGGMLLGAQPIQQPASAAAPTLSAAASPLDLLGGLSFGGSPSPAAPAAPAAAPPAGGLGDLLGGLSLGPASQPVPGMGGPSSSFPLQQQQQQWPGMPQQPLGGLGWGAPQQPAPHLGGVPGAAGGYQLGTSGLGTQGQAPPPFHHHHQLGPAPGAALHGTLSGTLASSGILDSNRDNAFNFVDDALAAARRKH